MFQRNGNGSCSAHLLSGQLLNFVHDHADGCEGVLRDAGLSQHGLQALAAVHLDAYIRRGDAHALEEERDGRQQLSFRRNSLQPDDVTIPLVVLHGMRWPFRSCCV